VAGKPERPLLDETVRRVGGTHPLMVGDRLDTDIEGADNAGSTPCCVLTGVTGLAELVAAPAHQRPTYLSVDLGGTARRPHPPGA
jgi:glycerol 3-phosphatase-2